MVSQPPERAAAEQGPAHVGYKNILLSGYCGSVPVRWAPQAEKTKSAPLRGIKVPGPRKKKWLKSLGKNLGLNRDTDIEAGSPRLKTTLL